jgi:hypothetical protein
MKTSTVGIVGVAILLMVAGVGIAQVGDTHTIGEFMEWQTLEASGGSQTAAAGSHTIGEFMEWQTPEASGGSQTAAAGSHTIGEFMEWQTRGPVETGAIPGAVFEESGMKDYGND